MAPAAGLEPATKWLTALSPIAIFKLKITAEFPFGGQISDACAYLKGLWRKIEKLRTIPTDPV